MKQLFKDVTDRIDSLGSLNWVDEDKGQMNFERPPVLFPAALVEIAIPKTHALNRKIQTHEVLLSVKLCFNFTGNTNTDTPALERDKSLAFYDIVEAVKNSLQGWNNNSFNALNFEGMHPQKRPDAYKVQELVFSTSYKDTNE